MTVRAGMDENDVYVSIHGRDTRTGYRTIFDLPVRPYPPIHHPFFHSPSHPSRPKGTQDPSKSYHPRAAMGSPEDPPIVVTQEGQTIQKATCEHGLRGSKDN
jgi:hypothetical protein